MSILRTSSFAGRPALALGNLADLDPLAAAQALWNPEELRPDELKTIVDKLDLGDGIFASILRTMTDPLVMVGLGLSLAFPIPLVRNIGKFSKQAVRSASRSGISTYFKSFWNIFRDKPGAFIAYDGAIANKVKYLDRFAPKWKKLYENFEKSAGRIMTKDEAFITSSTLGGLDSPIKGFYQVGTRTRIPAVANAQAMKAATTPELNTFIKSSRRLYDEMFDYVWINDPLLRKELNSAMVKHKLKLHGFRIPDVVRRGLLKSEHIKRLSTELRGLGTINIGGYEKKYLPRILTSADRQFEELQALKELKTRASSRVQGKVVTADLDSAINAHLHARDKLGSAPSIRELKQFPHLTNPEGVARLEELLARKAAAGTPIPEYTLHIETINQRYVNSMAASYGFNMDGAGRKLWGLRDDLLKTNRLAPHTPEGHSAAIRARLLENVYIPMARGRMTPKQAAWADSWANHKLKASEFFGPEGTGAATLNKVPGGKSLSQWLNKMLAMDEGPFNAMTGSSSITGLIYNSTLGANMGPTTLNTMQNLITGANVIGWPAMIKGYGQAMKKGKVVFQQMRKGKPFEEAMRAKGAFTEFAEAGLIDSPLIREAFEGSWRQARALTPLHGAKKAYHIASQALLGPFKASEFMNRASVFEGALSKGIKEGLTKVEAMTAGRHVVQLTQFMGGPATAPAMIADWPQLLRQYLQFPWKAAEYAASTARTLGTGQAGVAGAGGAGYGILGRTLLAGSLTYNIGMEAFGADLSRGLVFGAMPAPMEGTPGYPMPMMPPIGSIALSGLQAAYEGDTEPLKRIAPLFVPGGVAATRASSYLFPAVGRSMGRRYADYSAPAPDGRYAVYSADGALIGYQSAVGLTMSAMGMPGTGEAQAESAGVQWLLSNRDSIREMRREYLDAMAANDSPRAQAAQDAWRRAFPGRGELLVKKQDIQAIHTRKNVSRLERILRTLPPDLRSQFAQAIQTSLFSASSEWLGYDPSLLTSHPTGKSRDPFRPGQRPQFQMPLPSGAPPRRGAAYRDQMSPFGGLDYPNLGTKPLPETGAPF